MSPRGTVTNLRIQSEDISSAAYTRSAAAVVNAYNGALPTGVAGAKSLTDSGTASTVYYAAGNVVLVPGKDYIASAMVKYVAGTGWLLLGGQGGASSGARYFNAQTGAVGTLAGVARNPNVDDSIGNGFLRVSHRFTAVYGIPNDLTIYLATGDGSATYVANGQSIIVTGEMIEEAAPGQLTPSPYYVSGATSGVGPRDTRENFARATEDLSNTTYWTRQAGVGAAAPATNNGRIANLVDFTAAASLNGIYQALPASILSAQKNTHAIWLRADTPGDVWLEDAYFGTLYRTICSLTTNWQRFMVTTPAYANVASIGGMFLAKPAANAANQFYASGAQTARTNQMPDYVRTTSGIYVPNGAPRSLAI